MAQLAVKHENQQIVEYHDFSGGLNTSNAPEYIGTNELAQAVNVEIDNGTGMLRTVAGTVQALSETVSGDFIGSVYDHIGESYLFFKRDRSVIASFVVSGARVYQTVGTLTGNLIPQCAAWEDGLLIASGRQLQYFHKRGYGDTYKNYLETILESPTICEGVFVKEGRIWTFYEDRIHVSGVGDETLWGDTTWGNKMAAGVDPYTIAMLHFDESTTRDECGGEWIVGDSALVTQNNAKFNGSLRFDDLTENIKSNIALGGQSFTIDCWLRPHEGTADCLTGIRLAPAVGKYALLHFEDSTTKDEYCNLWIADKAAYIKEANADNPRDPLSDWYDNALFYDAYQYHDEDKDTYTLPDVSPVGTLRTTMELGDAFTVEFWIRGYTLGADPRDQGLSEYTFINGVTLQAPGNANYKIGLIFQHIDKKINVSTSKIQRATFLYLNDQKIELTGTDIELAARVWRHYLLQMTEAGILEAYINGEYQGMIAAYVPPMKWDIEITGHAIAEVRIDGQHSSWYSSQQRTPPDRPYGYNESVGTCGIILDHRDTSKITCKVSNATSPSTGTKDVSVTFPLGRWHHFAFAYDGTTHDQKFFVDGVSQGTFNGTIDQKEWIIDVMGQYIDELRVSNIVRWTDGFTPPTDFYGADRTDTTDSGPAWVEVGYKDGGNIVAMTNLANDILVFKDNNYAYRLVGQYPDWEVKEISRDVPCRNRLACVSLVNETVVLGDSTLQIVSVTQDYGEMRADDVGNKVRRNIIELPGDVRLRYLPVLNQIWFITGEKGVLFYSIKYGAFFFREFATPVVDVFAVGDTVYVAKNEGLMKLDNDIFTDNRAALAWKWQGKSIVSFYEYLLKRIQCWFTQLTDSKPTCEITVGNVVASPDFTGGSPMTAHNLDIRCVERAKTLVVKGQGQGGQLLFDSIACEIAEV